jgi:hypothetical protein
MTRTVTAKQTVVTVKRPLTPETLIRIHTPRKTEPVSVEPEPIIPKISEPKRQPVEYHEPEPEAEPVAEKNSKPVTRRKRHVVPRPKPNRRVEYVNCTILLVTPEYSCS